jgi:subtilisin family serine protease
VPLVSVGALNPDGTDALFSNAGPWVRAWTPGAALVSTMPVTFHGGIEPLPRGEAFGRARSALDPDDYRSGFAVWSGTSFSAPLLAGRMAANLAQLPDDGPRTLQRPGVPEAVSRAWEQVGLFTGMRA